jgi:hypothetical protein
MSILGFNWKKGAKFELLTDVLYLYRRHRGQLTNWFIQSLKLDVIVYSEFYNNEKIRMLIEQRSNEYYLFFILTLLNTGNYSLHVENRG